MPFDAVDTDIVDTDIKSRDVEVRVRAGDMLAERGVYGIVWFDENLLVHRRYGVLTAFVEEGVCVTRSVPPLVGLEKDIKQLTDAGAVHVPNVKIVRAPDADGPRLNIVVYRFPSEGGYVMTLGQMGTDSGLEIELSRQIRARLMAEAEVMEKSRELARANAELRMANSDLEQFAAIVTHDLKSPMRALGYLVEDIDRAACRNDSLEVRRKLAELHRQTMRMSHMLSALLDYASAGPAEAGFEHVAPQEIVGEIVRSLPRGGMDVEIRGTWPAIETLAVPFDLALRNLIENAIKHHDRDQGTIVVCCEDAGDALDITVEDDGPGIASEHHASIFLPFRTLGPTGSGMGLALAKKMVEAVGGSIALKDASGTRGTCFKVHWPKQVVD